MNPEVTVVIPAFNSGRYLSSCIDSVRAQTFDKWEMLVVDGGSTDGTDRLVSEYAKQDARIRLIRNVGDRGPLHARSTGIRHAAGDYIAFIDADDLWEPEKLEMQTAFMKKHGHTFTFTDYWLVSDHGVRSKSATGGWSTNTFNQYLGRRGIANSTVVVSRECFDDEILNTVGVGLGEDTLWWLLVMRAGHVAHALKMPLACYRNVQGSRSSQVFANQVAVWRIYRSELNIPIITAVICYGRYIADVAIRRVMLKLLERRADT